MLIAVIAMIIFAVGADQLTKELIFEKSMAVIPGFIRFDPVENGGMAWGLMNGVKWFPIAVSIATVVVIGVVIFIIIKYKKSMGAVIALSLAAIVGGAIGNLIDRIRFEYVRDFIRTEFIEFPVFNVADMFITCGAILLGIMLIFTKKGHSFLSVLFPEDEKKKKGSGAE